MKFRHFVITRFSYRDTGELNDIGGPRFFRGNDPLNPRRLEQRFKLFELTCLPSMRAQVEQNFAWIILVDRELAVSYRERLRSLTNDRNDTFIRVLDSEMRLASVEWLKPYLLDGPDYIVTTNLDDDDSLPTRFVAEVHKRLRALESAGGLPLIGLIGAKDTVEWDVLTSDVAPLGWKAPWHRGRAVASAGFTLFCKVPEFALCVMALEHRGAGSCLDFSRPPVHRNAVWFRSFVVAGARAIGVDVQTWKRENLFYDISTAVGPVLMTNHMTNDQANRLFERKADRTIVTGANDFPDLPVDWGNARAYARFFREPQSDRGQQLGHAAVN